MKFSWVIRRDTARPSPAVGLPLVERVPTLLFGKTSWRKNIPISLDFIIHSGSETPFGQALRAFLVCPKHLKSSDI